MFAFDVTIGRDPFNVAELEAPGGAWYVPIERILAMFGARVRTRARGKIKYSAPRRGLKRAVLGGNSSRPGDPPVAHTRDEYASLRNIVYRVDAARNDVTIGVVSLGARRPGVWREHYGAIGVTPTVDQNVPALIEVGGLASVPKRFRNKTVSYRARPFLRPSFEEELRELPEFWQRAII